MIDAILIPGGGVRNDGLLPIWVKRRLDKVLEIHNGEYIITMSAGSVHKPQALYDGKYPIIESRAYAKYLQDNGISPSLLLFETASLDTIGNAYFAKLIHIDRLGFRNLLIVTSEFHMPRTKEIFNWIFSLVGTTPRQYKLDFVSVSDDGISKDIINPRIEKEYEGLQNVKRLIQIIHTMREFEEWLFSKHGVYSLANFTQVESDDILISY
jgi:hypothetical protein